MTPQKRDRYIQKPLEGFEALPFNQAAEEACLGAAMLDPMAVHTVVGLLKESDFYVAKHKIVFKAISRVSSRGEEVDLVTVHTELENLKLLVEAGGSATLADLLGKIASAGNVEAYCNRVIELARLRRLFEATKRIMGRLDEARSTEDAGSHIIEEAENLIFDVGEERMKDLVEKVGEGWEIEFERLKELKNTGKKPGVQSGFDGYDKITGGFHAGQMVVLAARPSVGKSALGWNMAVNMAKRKIPVAFFSLEMTKEELRARTVSSEGGINGMQLRSGVPDDHTLQTYKRIMETLDGLPLYLNDDSHMHLARIVSAMRLLVRKMKVKVVFIDYLQLMGIANFKGKRYEEVTKISAAMKREAKKLGITVVCLAQVNREAVSGGKKDRPQVWHLRESGTIEQDADVIVLLHPDDDPTRVCAYVDKNRGGPKDLFWLDFHAPFLRFVDQPQHRPEN